MRSRWRIHTWVRLAAVLACILAFAAPGLAGSEGDKSRKLDSVLEQRTSRGGTSRVIVTVLPGGNGDAVSTAVRRLGGRSGRRLDIINGFAAVLPNKAIEKLAEHPAVFRIQYDRPAGAHMNRVATTVGARAVQQNWGYDGAGVGVAVIDSGMTGWHDDLTYRGWSSAVRVNGGQRVAAFVDMVNGRSTPYDDNGHGTHVSGIIAGNGYDSWGARAGIAPAAHIVSLKVLDDQGRGRISNLIAALGWAVEQKALYNIRVINLSVGAAITESYNTDPLTIAAKRAVESGLVVVTAAGNFGKNAEGQPQYGGITAPGNAPWVLTVGASSTEGTVIRTDDVIASYSSRGPSAIDFEAKPDLVAPGTGVVSLSDPASAFYTTKSAYLLDGTLPTSYKPYLSLSGTSMAAPVVSGTVALMLQANPSLTPNLVKAILQYTAQSYGYDALTQGAGFLNSQGAVKLARYFSHARAGDPYPGSPAWSRQIIWGSHRLSGGAIAPAANAWATNVVWGTAVRGNGDNIVWGTLCGSSCDNIVWGTVSGTLDNIVWGTISGDNIVWGTARDGDNIVWGTMASTLDNIVWGTDCGGSNCDNIVWGTARDGDNIVWGTARDGDNIVWGTAREGDNIVWGTAREGDNIVWGTSGDEDVTWGSSGDGATLFDDPGGDPVNYDGSVFDALFGSESGDVVSTFTGGGF